MLLELVELACNQALEHAPESLSKLQSLSGNTIVLEIKNINQSVTIEPQPFGVELSLGASESATVTLAATPAALIKIARSGMENADLEPGELEIHGDPIVAQKIAGIASNLEVDWDELLAEHLGEMPASLLSQGVSIAKAAAEQGGEQLKSKVNQALQTDFELVAAPDQVEDYLEGVDDLRAVVDRLELRLKKLLDHGS